MNRRLPLLLALAVACDTVEAPLPPEVEITGPGPFLVSNAVLINSSGPHGGGVSSHAFVALVPGTLAGGSVVQMLVHGDGTVVTAPLVDGGLDPVPVPATVGDTIILTVTGPAGPVAEYAFTVPRVRRPTIVRTAPHLNRDAIPLDARINVVFSEPIAPSSLTPANFGLFVGSTLIAGASTFTDVTLTSAVFTPAAPLMQETAYRLLVGAEILDLDGYALGADTTIVFTTTTTPPAPTGQVSITTATTGTEHAPADYAVIIDGRVVTRVVVNGSVMIGDLPPGQHTVALSGFGSGCFVAGGRSRNTLVTSGVTTAVGFEVACAVAAVNQIAFVRDDQIYIVNTDGTGLVQLTNSPPGVRNTQPAWSPDGRHLALVRTGGDTHSGIWVMDADGSNARPLSNGVDPAWSPDGGTIAFSSFLDGSTAIFTVNVDGRSEPRVLFNRTGFDADPAWSPDGRKLSFTSDWNFYDGTLELWTINPDGTGASVLLEAKWEEVPGVGPVLPWTHYFGADWSPDGRQVAAVRIVDHPTGGPSSYEFRRTQELMVANADGSGERVLEGIGGPGTAAWLPDGKTILFSSGNCRRSLVCIRFVRVDGSADGVIIEDGHMPAVRPER